MLKGDIYKKKSTHHVMKFLNDKVGFCVGRGMCYFPLMYKFDNR